MVLFDLCSAPACYLDHLPPHPFLREKTRKKVARLHQDANHPCSYSFQRPIPHLATTGEIHEFAQSLEGNDGWLQHRTFFTRLLYVRVRHRLYVYRFFKERRISPSRTP